MTAGRIDYLDDPNAPEPNSLIPAANVIVERDDGKILLIRRTDNGNFALPGGGMDLGESITQTAVRETKEETGLDVEITGLVGIYTNPNHLIEYLSDGEIRQEFAIVFRARAAGGSPATSSESSEVVWIDPNEVAGLEVHPTMRQRIQDFVAAGPPYLG